MADSEPIKASEIIDPSAFPKFIEDAERLAAAMNKVVQAFTDTMVASKGLLNKPIVTTADAENIQKVTTKTNELSIAKTKLTSATKRLTIDIAEAKLADQQYNTGIKELAKNNLGLTSEYQKQSKILDELRARAKDLLLSKNELSVADKKLINDAKELDAKLKGVDSIMGQHQRNVGNYNGSIQKLGKGIAGVTGLVGTFGSAIGLNTELLEHFSAISKELIKTVKEYHHATELSEVAEHAAAEAHGENAVAMEAETVAAEEGTVAAEGFNAVLAANPIGAVIIGLTALVAVFELLGSRSVDTTAATENFTKACEEQLKVIDDLKFSIANLSIENKVLAGTMNEITGDKLKNKLIAFKTAKGYVEDFNKKVEESNKKFDESKSQFMGPDQLKEIERQKEAAVVTLRRNLDTQMILLKIESADEEKKIDLKYTKESHKDIEKEERIHQEKIVDIKNTYKNKDIEKVQADAKKMKEDADDPKFSPRIAAHQNQIIADNKLYDQEKIDALKTAEDLLKIEKEFQDEKARIRLDAIDYDIEKNRSSIEVQAQLAAAGRENTLQYELKRQDELEKKRQDEIAKEKKQAKEQEALALALAVVVGYEKNLAAGEKPIKALFDAIAGAEGAKIAGKGIAGSAFDGIEDTGEAGDVDNKGGRLWVLHPHERVVKASDNAKLAGMSNEDLVSNALMFESIYKPNSDGMLADVSRGTQIDNALNTQLINEIKDLKQVIKNKPENNWNFDHLGNLIHKRIENGMSQTTIKQTFLKG